MRMSSKIICLTISLLFGSVVVHAGTIENVATISALDNVHAVRDNNNPNCPPAVCKTLCVDYEWSPNVQFQAHLETQGGVGGHWTSPNANPDAADGGWNFGRVQNAVVHHEPGEALGHFCAVGKNWASYQREFRLRVITP